MLKLIALIGKGLAYDETALTIATYLHDWGAYLRYQQASVEHALRSRQVAETMILPRMDVTETEIAATRLTRLEQCGQWLRDESFDFA